MINLLKKMNPSKFHLLLIISVVAVILLLSYVYNQHNQILLKEDQIAALSDTVTIYKTKQGKNAAYIRILSGTKSELLEMLKKKDAESYKLIKETKNLQSLTNLRTITRVDTITKVDTMVVTDNDHNPATPDSIYITKHIKNQYYDADIKVIQDSIAFKLSVINDFNIITRYKSNGLFKRKSLIVDVINKNPYTVTTGLQSFQIIQPKSKIGLKIGLGLGVAAGAYLLLK